ncbi:MAG: exopolysaccharide biosynthesis polyprenyl glycosylphosphotransferase, partial [Bdellovibrionota bacterium]
GWIDSDGAAQKYNIPELTGNIMNLRSKITIDFVVVSYSNQDANKIGPFLKENFNDVVPFVVLPDLTYSYLGYSVTHMAGMPALSVNQPDFSTIDIITKRIFDFLATGLGLLIISPILLIVAILIKLESKGPIFYGQERVGLDGEKFKMWKFRSMRIGAEFENGDAPGWTVKGDARITKIGKFIRSTSIDELPQLWNVFVGDMSLVGPRPERDFFVQKFRNEIPAYMLRHKMKAGITGWAQINGWRGDTSIQKRVECDLYYINNWSIWLDIKIIFMTFAKGFINKNAY